MISSDPLKMYRSGFGAVARDAICEQFNRITANLPGTVEGEDIEALHDMRVASRRMRASLKVFKACLPKKHRNPVEETVRNLTQSLGAVRDHDVFLEYLRDYQRQDKTSIKWLIQHEVKLREDARLEMLKMLAEYESSDIAERVEGMLDRVKMLWADNDKLSSNRFGEHALRLVSPRLRDLVESSGSIANPDDVAGLHLMRILAKKLRYTMEAFSPCFGTDMEQAISDLKNLQTLLGQIHDFDVWSEKLAQYRETVELTARRNESLEELIAVLKSSRDQEYASVVDYWQKLNSAGFSDNLIRIMQNQWLLAS